MVHAFVMVDVAAGTAERVVEGVRVLDHVEEAHVVAGEHDVIAEVDAPDVQAVLALASDVRALDGVTDTRTYVAMD
ncbi:MAG: Lrp/AsnC family transcriptional regulator [Haloferacaceae archaeon]